MQKVIAFLAWNALPCFLSAQYEQILKDPDVIYAAEMEVVYHLFLPGNEPQANDILFWKNFDPKDQTPMEGAELMAHKLLQAIQSGHWPTMRFDSIQHRLVPIKTTDPLELADLVVVFDPVTGEERVVEIKNAVDPARVVAIKAKQLLFYRRKTGAFELFTSAIKLIIGIKNSGDKSENYRIDRMCELPFWLEMPRYSPKKRVKINDPKVVWAAQIRTLENTPVMATLVPLKDTRTPVMQVVLDRFVNDRCYPAQNSLGDPICFKDRGTLVFSRDTVLIFNAETYEETRTVVDKSIYADQLYKLRLIEEWYWDDRKQRLEIRLSRFAPLRAVLDANDNFRFDAPLFFH